MNKKGFTLIEILSVVVLLGAIALIAIPTIKNLINDSKQKLYDEQINLIEDGLKNWGSANVLLLPESNETIKLSLGQLKQAGFADIKITNPKNNKCFSNDSVLSIKRYNNSYIYDVENIVDTDCDLVDDTPSIKLNGDIIEYLYIGDTYVDKGATAKDSSGNDITDSITTTISGSGTSIDTSKAGNYTVTYKVVNNGKTATMIKNIFITYKYKNGIMSSMDNCINTGTCASGTLVNVKVNANENYNFYVISDVQKKLTLIMDKVLGKTIAWIDEDDYEIENSVDDEPNVCSAVSCNDEGPITAINYLDELTDNEWNNVPKKAYTYSGIGHDGKTRKYEDITVTMRARMISYREVNDIKSANNGVLPTYVYGQTGHWTSTAYSSNENNAYYINAGGNVYLNQVHYVAPYSGIRPVIELSK